MNFGKIMKCSKKNSQRGTCSHALHRIDSKCSQLVLHGKFNNKTPKHIVPMQIKNITNISIREEIRDHKKKDDLFDRLRNLRADTITREHCDSNQFGFFRRRRAETAIKNCRQL